MSRTRLVLAALVVAASASVGLISGAALAAKGLQGPVAVASVTTPALTVDRTAYQDNAASFSLGSAATFTQKAGQVVLVTAQLSATSYVGGVETGQGAQLCDLNVVLRGDTGTQDPTFGVHLYRLAARGDVELRTQSVAIPAPATDTVTTMSATAEEQQATDWDDTNHMWGHQQCPADAGQTFKATLNVSIVALPQTAR